MTKYLVLYARDLGMGIEHQADTKEEAIEFVRNHPVYNNRPETFYIVPALLVTSSK